MAPTLTRICVFCGSNAGADPEYRAAAVVLGSVLAKRGIELVYGGGRVGLMGALADSVLQGGGHVIGVIPDALVAREVAHQGLPDLRVVDSMHARKALMADLADAFIAMPGGFGTFEEFCETLTWAQLGLHSNPCGLLNVRGFYDPLIRLFDHAVQERFLHPAHRSLVIEDDHPARLIDRLVTFRVPAVAKWLDRDDT